VVALTGGVAGGAVGVVVDDDDDMLSFLCGMMKITMRRGEDIDILFSFSPFFFAQLFWQKGYGY
jgi:hypothetical protein